MEKIKDLTNHLTSQEKRRLRNEWMKSEKNRKQYGGQYVALDGDKVVATGRNCQEAVRKAREVGVPEAIVDMVHSSDYIGETGAWE